MDAKMNLSFHASSGEYIVSAHVQSVPSLATRDPTDADARADRNQTRLPLYPATPFPAMTRPVLSDRTIGLPSEVRSPTPRALESVVELEEKDRFLWTYTCEFTRALCPAFSRFKAPPNDPAGLESLDDDEPMSFLRDECVGADMRGVV